MNYFDVFDLPISYNIDVEALTQNYFSLQRSSDRNIDARMLNEVYSVLKNDVKRAEYFLSLKNISTEKMSPDLAIKMFEMREKYSSLAGDDEKIEFQKQIKNQMKKLVSVLKKNENDLKNFSDIFSELKFLNSFLEKERADVYSRN